MRARKLIVGLVLFIPFMLSFEIFPVIAQPVIATMEYQVSGNEIILTLTLEVPHVIDSVEVDLDGNVQTIAMAENYTRNVQVNVGAVEGAPLVRARTRCRSCGWSDWSESMEIPEFPTTSLLIILAIISAALIYLTSRFRTRKYSPK